MQALAAVSHGPSTMAGALKFPAFLLVWSVGVVLATSAVFPADALVRPASYEFSPLPEVPSVADATGLAAELEHALAGTDVVSGSWHPSVAEEAVPVPEINPHVAFRSPPRMVKIQRVPQTGTVAAEAAAADLMPVAEAEATTEVASGQSVLKPLSDKASNAKREARRALATGKPRTAYRLLMSQVEHAAVSTDYLALLAVTALSVGRDAEALLIYERLVVLSPRDERWWAGAALCRERLGMDATEMYRGVLALAGERTPLKDLARSRLQGLG